MRLYSLAFGLLVAAIVTLALAVAGFLESTGLLFVSAGLSALAIAAAAASILMRR